jgi:hypothetical protein
MGYIASKCHTMLMPSGTYHDPDRKHLYIVCTDVCSNGNHLIVSVTGWTNDLCDATTRICPADKIHDFITKDSYIFYRKSKIEAASALSNGVDQGIFILRDPISEDFRLKILEGICASKQTPQKVKNYAGCKKSKPNKLKIELVRSFSHSKRSP